MLQKSVEDFAENDIKFKELVKDAVREELKSYKEHNDELIREIFELLKLHRENTEFHIEINQKIFELFKNDINAIEQSLEDLRMNYKDFKRASIEVMRDQIKNLDNIFNEIYKFVDEIEKEKGKVPTELLEVLIKMEAKFQSQRNDINVIAYSLRTLQMDYKDFKKKQKIERKIENLDKANSNKVEILDIEGGSDGK